MKFQYQKKPSAEDITFIENCTWELKCPVALSAIIRTDEENVDYCTVCNQNVYLVTTVAQLKDRVAQNQCVAIDFSKNVTNTRKPIRIENRRKGKIVRKT